MFLQPEQLIISEEKILNYLLVEKEKNDKFKFLQQLGFTRANYLQLIEEIKQIATTNAAVLSRVSEFGNLYRIEGLLRSSLVLQFGLNRLKKTSFNL